MCVMIVLSGFINSSIIKAEERKSSDSIKVMYYGNTKVMHLTSKKDIMEYQENMGMNYDSSIVEVYRMIEIPNKTLKPKLYYLGDDYEIRKKKVSTKTDKDNILRQYKRPAGTIKLKESVNIKNQYSVTGEVTASILKAQLGYSVTATNTFEVEWKKI